MSHTFDAMAFCPICKDNTPHDYRSSLNACKVCGMVRMSDCEGAFKRCRCGEFIPARPSSAIDVEKEQMIVTAPPAHNCKCTCPIHG